MSDKIKAKNFAHKLGLPIIPGSKKNIKTFSEAKIISKEIGYPVLVKASHGGGGRGIKKLIMKMISRITLMAKKRQFKVLEMTVFT